MGQHDAAKLSPKPGKDARHLWDSGQSPTLKAKPSLAAEAALNAKEALKGYGQHDVAKPSPKRGMDAAQTRDGGENKSFPPVFFSANAEKKTYS